MVTKSLLTLNKSDFTLEVELEYRRNPSDGYMGAVLKLCQEIGCDPKAVSKKLSPDLVDKIENEAYHQRFFLKDKKRSKKSRKVKLPFEDV
jgi:hypothetical protein